MSGGSAFASGGRMPSDWGPPGLETTPPRVNKALVVLVSLCVVTIVGVPWCHENAGSIDLMTGNRSCPTAPSEIKVWAGNYHTGRADEAVNLQSWISRHPGRINQQYGAFCDTPLHLAARFGREDLAGPLVAAGADVEAQNELGNRPLHLSASYGHPTVTKLLLARGAAVGARDRGGKTPLHAAAFGLGDQSRIDARIEVARLLIGAGADVNARQPGSGFTPLRYARSYESRNSAMAALLLTHGADPRGAEETR
ncbi:MAG TPA: ankyrin repeat domain-containing protein [Vicinamibacterales bacterium]|nr:ankyrin repeat domain-containing protein [Vicinamibacterales bacterium]